MTRQLTLNAARQTLIAAGYSRADVSELVRSIKADAWDSGALWAAVECGVIPTERTRWLCGGDNPYRDNPHHDNTRETALFEATP